MDWRGKLIVANTADDSLSVIDPVKMTEVYRIKLQYESCPYKLVYVKKSSRLLILQPYSDSVSSFSLLRGFVDKTSVVGCNPSYVALDASEKKAYVSNADSESISIINANSLELISQIKAGFMPQGIACHPYLPIVAVANMNSKDVWLIETKQNMVNAMIRIDEYPCQVLFRKDGKHLYVGCCYSEQQHGKIKVFDIPKLQMVSEIDSAAIPLRMAETTYGDFLLVASAGAGMLDVIKTVSMRIHARIKTGSMAHDVAIDPFNQNAYITNTLDGTVSVVDWRAGEKIRDIKVGKEPNGIASIWG